MLHIKRPKDNSILGSTLKIGDTFVYNQCYYIIPENSGEKSPLAVDLESGERIEYFKLYVTLVELSVTVEAQE